MTEEFDLIHVELETVVGMCAYPRTVGRVAFDPAGMSVLATTLRKCSAAGFGALRFSRQSADRYLLHSQRVHFRYKI